MGRYESKMNAGMKSSSTEDKHSIVERRHYSTLKDKPGSDGRVVNSVEYAIAWGVMNRPYTKSQLCKMCKAPDAPSFRYLMKTFLTYERYYKALLKAGMAERPMWHQQERDTEIRKSKSFSEKSNPFSGTIDIAQMASHYGICNRKQYRIIRKSNIESRSYLPPENVISRIYGTFDRFMVEVMKYNADATITQYVEMSHECGKWLTLRECDRRKLPIRGIMDLLRPSVFNALCYHKMRIMYPDFDKRNEQE